MLKLINIGKEYRGKKARVQALQNIDISIEAGEIFGVIGRSGAGKSTLVRCMNLLEKPSDGQVFLNGIELTALSEKELRAQRSKIGMIFQQFNLLEQRSVLANVCFPLELAKVDKQTAKNRAKETLELVGLADKENAYPSQLSGGQKQRVAIARALVSEPQVLLCDEATSALDPATRNSILELLKTVNRKLGVTIVLITHEMAIVQALCKRVAVLENGAMAELGNTRQVFESPKSMATRALLEERKIIHLQSSAKKGA